MAIPKHPTFVTLSFLSILAAPVALPPLVTSASAASGLTAADTDKDGTLDEAEVDAAAGTMFDKLNPDNDGTLDAKEAAGHVSDANFKDADTDGDATSTKTEYTGLADKLFKVADADNGGTLDAKELHSEPGTQLDRLMN
jgi:hypothetical protein